MKRIKELRKNLKNISRMESYNGALTLVSGWSGVDFFTVSNLMIRLSILKPMRFQSMLDAYVNADPNRIWTIEEIAHWNSVGGKMVLCWSVQHKRLLMSYNNGQKIQMLMALI